MGETKLNKEMTLNQHSDGVYAPKDIGGGGAGRRESVSYAGPRVLLPCKILCGEGLLRKGVRKPGTKYIRYSIETLIKD